MGAILISIQVIMNFSNINVLKMAIKDHVYEVKLIIVIINLEVTLLVER